MTLRFLPLIASVALIGAGAVAAVPAAADAPVCSLIATSEVSGVTGVLMQPIPQFAGMANACGWQSPLDHEGGRIKVMITRQPAMRYDYMILPAPKKTVTPINGLGSKAAMIDMGTAQLVSLDFAKGPSVYTVAALGSALTIAQEKAMDQQIAMDLAKKV